MSWKGFRGGETEAEGEGLKDGGAETGHEDDEEEFVTEFGSGREIDGPISSTNATASVLWVPRQNDRGGLLTDQSMPHC